jgi:hypothetical protein
MEGPLKTKERSPAVKEAQKSRSTPRGVARTVCKTKRAATVLRVRPPRARPSTPDSGDFACVVAKTVRENTRVNVLPRVIVPARTQQTRSRLHTNNCNVYVYVA